MPEQSDFDPSLSDASFKIVVAPNNEQAGYRLIQPSPGLLRETTEYVGKVQARASSPNTAFIPTGVGMLITPQQENFVFSMYGAGEGNVYDVPSIPVTPTTIETSDVSQCGVTTLEFEGYKLLTHAMAPEANMALVARGIDLAKNTGASVERPINVNLAVNPQLGYDTYINGPQGYVRLLENLENKIGVDFVISQRPVSDQARIKV